MAQPDFLNTAICPYSFTSSAGITDVATVITDIRTALVTGLGWTEPSAGLFQSPSNGGQWFDILLTRITAVKLEFRVRDYLGRTICTRRVNQDASTNWNYYCGKYYVFMEALNGASSEILQAWMPDPSPDAAGDVQNIIFATGRRSSADADDGQGNQVGMYFQWEDNSSVLRTSRLMPATVNTANSLNITRTTGSLALMFDDAQMGLYAANYANPPRYYGRLWHAYFIDSSIAFQTDKTVMVSDAESATFRVVGLSTVGVTRLCLRK